MSPPQGGSKGGRGRFFPYRRNATVDRRPKPISVPITSDLVNNSDAASSGYGSFGTVDTQPNTLMHIGLNIEQYPGWNLYFPEESKIFLRFAIQMTSILTFFFSFCREFEYRHKTESI